MSNSSDTVRNFCIIAHIDHGKSTLADRLLELTGTVERREMKAQLLDRMDLEREKGITIKLQPVRMHYKGYELNLIDTPGHVDFSYEVSRSLAACETALLVVDATQGIQAQTLANLYLALAADLTIIPILNKIDLPAADPERVSNELVTLLGCKEEEIIQVSAKTGQNVEEVLERIVSTGKSPAGTVEGPLRALVFDSVYDDYRGVILYIRIVDGALHKNEPVSMLATHAGGIALDTGHLSPELVADGQLTSGQIGYVVTNFKSTSQARVGDTLTSARQPASMALPGYKEAKPFVYAGIFPSSHEEHEALKEALAKLSLNDAALIYTPENSQVLGFGFRVGFLGLLHMEIVKERLEREYDLELIVTQPSTDYRVLLTTGEEVVVKSAADLPDVSRIQEIKEPWIEGEIVCPKSYVGSALQLIVKCRGRQKKIDYVDDQLTLISFEAPLATVLTDFYDQLKSITSGYGTFNYDIADYRVEDLVRLDFLVASERIDSLSVMVHRSEAEYVGREIVARLKDIIPKQLFKVSLQAAIGTKFIAREDIQALKKDVTGHLYGGDVSRKKKLWAKQKAGKARMKRFGKVDIPADVFTVLLKRD
ncbi:MAG TPA: translation elongation factor 4 [Candidatus Saccharimonadales bacterium]|nr:translation elongation factor 4 [Candidatus Saccharimonadales bacterium]